MANDWTNKREEEVLGLDDDRFLNVIETARLNGEQAFPGSVLDRLVAMADARPVLRDVEWSGADKTCPACGGFKPGEPKRGPLYRSGHDPECQLAHVLKA